jgi:hypothetical protein
MTEIFRSRYKIPDFPNFEKHIYYVSCSYSFCFGFSEDFYGCKTKVRHEIREIDKRLELSGDFPGAYFVLMNKCEPMVGRRNEYRFWAFSSESKAKLGIEEIMIQLIHFE